MSQINIKKSSTFNLPPSDYLGYGFNDAGTPVIIQENGTVVEIPLNESTSSFTKNIIANLGIGLYADLPSSFTVGDIYVTTDTNLIYEALDSETWGTTSLQNGQFATDTLALILYQYDGTDLLIVGQGFEIEEHTVLDGATNQYIIVGDTTLHKFVRIKYYATRDTLIEYGEIIVTNKSDIVAKQITSFDYSGMEVQKNINGTDIRLDITDMLIDGNDIDVVFFEIKRILI